MPEHAKKRILLVDDAPANLDILVETLGESYNVRVATDGVQALEAVDTERPDLILLDILMPEMDGYEVCRKLKQTPGVRDVPVIFLTCLTEAEDETRGFELGGVDYITKPFSTAVVTARVKIHLELAAARKHLERQNDILKDNIRLREQVEQVTRHDLRNPLQVILASAQIFNSDSSLQLEDIRKMARGQVAACHTILNMLNRSLDLYRLENESYTLSPVSVDLLPMLDQILLGCRPMAPASLGLRIFVNGSPRRPEDQFELVCDEMLFYAMLSNLITNALEASPENGVVDISLSMSEGPRISIENQGVVPPEIRDRFFEKFVTAGKPGGTGLGTYSARLAVLSHGGEIALFTSDDHNHTKVTISFDRQAPAPAET